MPAPTPHSLTTHQQRPLILALAASFALHLLPFLPDIDFEQKSPSTVSPLQAQIRPPQPQTQAPLSLRRQPTATAPATPESRQSQPDKSTGRPPGWAQVVQQHFRKLDQQRQFYPEEAIRQGLEGDALILLIIDEQGQVAGARLEQGSGHPILDDAALRAVRALKSLPDDAPRQTLLPVRFRLK